MKEIEQILKFMIELEKLKNVFRKSRPVGLNRYENSAEHSWQVCLSALMLKDYSNEAVDIDRVIRMLLIHDLGEIDAGDKIIYESEKPELKKQEADGVRRILDILPAGKGDEYMELWYEFESGETEDSRFARAIDRVPPLLQNLSNGGLGWKENGIKAEQVFTLNSRIGKGSSELWNAVRSRLNEGVEKGILK